MDFFTRYNPPPARSVKFESETLAQQHFKDECDINSIMRRYQKTGFLVDPLTPVTTLPQFGDFSTEYDFHAAQTLIAHATQEFDELPAWLRKRFSNNPSELLAFLENESNREEAIKLGLISQSTDSASSQSSTSTVSTVPGVENSIKDGTNSGATNGTNSGATT